jgi:aspartyl protease family protein
MLVRVLIFAGLTVVVATQLPAYLQSRIETPPVAASLQTSPQADPTEPAPGYGQAVLAADRKGHFTANFRINGKSVDAMIDTGATSVAINETTARRVGFSGNDLNFKYKVNTANGETVAAVVMIDRIEVGGVRVDDVQAMVLKDKALSGTLIGMTFMKKLGSYKVENGQMRLSQR